MMGVGPNQFSWQDPMRNAGLVASVEARSFEKTRSGKKNMAIGIILSIALISVIVLIIVLFIAGSKGML